MAAWEGCGVECSDNNIKYFFKCCKNKGSTVYYVCIKCHCVMHKSCLRRLKHTYFVSEHKIICTSCLADNNTSEATDEHQLCKETVEELKSDNDQKTDYINKLNDKFKSYYDDSIEMENKLNQTITEHEKTIAMLEQNIKSLKDMLAKTEESKKVLNESETDKEFYTGKNTVNKIQRGTQTELNKIKNVGTQTSNTKNKSETTRQKNKNKHKNNSEDSNNEVAMVRKVLTKGKKKEVNKSKHVKQGANLINSPSVDEIKNAHHNKTEEKELLLTKKNRSKIQEAKKIKYAREQQTNMVNDFIVEELDPHCTEKGVNPRKKKKINRPVKDMKQNTNTSRNNAGRPLNEEIEEALEIEETTNVGESKRKIRNKVLVIGDELATNVASRLHSLADETNFIIEGIVKPHIDFTDLTKSLFDNSMQYGENDFILLMFNTINISNYNSLKYALKHVLGISKVTNMIILSNCNLPNDVNIENHIHNEISKYCHANRSTSINYISNIRNIKHTLHYIIKTYIPLILNSKNKSLVLKTVQTRLVMNNNKPKQLFLGHS